MYLSPFLRHVKLADHVLTADEVAELGCQSVLNELSSSFYSIRP